MDFYFGLLQIIGVHTLVGLSAYVVLLTGQVSLAQAGFMAIGAYVSAMLTVLAQWALVPALLAGSAVSGVIACAVGFPALRVRGLMLVVATLAFGEAVRLFFFNFDYQIAMGGIKVGPLGGEGFRQIRYFPQNGWTTFQVMIFIWLVLGVVMTLLWWLDRSRAGAALRAVGEDETAAQSSGLNLTAIKVSAMSAGGSIAGLAGGLYAHYTTHIEQGNFNVLVATFAIAYPILGGLSSVFGTLAAVIFIQAFLVEGLRFLGDWRNLLFGALVVLAMNVRPNGLLGVQGFARGATSAGTLFGWRDAWRRFGDQLRSASSALRSGLGQVHLAQFREELLHRVFVWRDAWRRVGDRLRSASSALRSGLGQVHLAQFREELLHRVRRAPAAIRQVVNRVRGAFGA
jgi:branched-chain amino acid transport system permease protein